MAGWLPVQKLSSAVRYSPIFGVKSAWKPACEEASACQTATASCLGGLGGGGEARMPCQEQITGSAAPAAAAWMSLLLSSNEEV